MEAASIALRSAGLTEDDLKKERGVYLQLLTDELAVYDRRAHLDRDDRHFLYNAAYTLRKKVEVEEWKSPNPKIRKQNIDFLKLVRPGGCYRIFQMSREKRLTDSDKQFIGSLVDCEGALGIKDAAYARGLLRRQSVSDSQYMGCMPRMDALRKELAKLREENEMPEFGSAAWWGRKKAESWLRSTADPGKFIGKIQSALVGSLAPPSGSLEIQEAVGMHGAHALVNSLPRLKASLEQAVEHAVEHAVEQAESRDRIRTSSGRDEYAAKRAIILYHARHPGTMQNALACSARPKALKATFDVCRFVRERCEEGGRLLVPMVVFRDEFNKWVGDGGQLDFIELSAAMRDMQYLVGRKRVSGGAPTQCQCYLGVDLKPLKPLKPAEDDNVVIGNGTP